MNRAAAAIGVRATSDLLARLDRALGVLGRTPGATLGPPGTPETAANVVPAEADNPVF
jgi:hypothetical protein